MSTQLPAKKKRTKGGRYSNEITKEEIEQYFHLPCDEASKQLGIGLTILKRICRRLGIVKWPYRQLKRANRLSGPNLAPNSATDDAPPGENRDLCSPFQAANADAGKADAQEPKGPDQQQQQQQQHQLGWGGMQVEELHSDGTGDSGGRWQAQHQGSRGTALDLSRQDSEQLTSFAAQGSWQQPGSTPTRPRSSAQQDGGLLSGRRSLDLGMLARQSISCLPGDSPGAKTAPSWSPGAASAAASAAGTLQRAQSAALKRIREEESESLLGMLGTSSEAEPSPNPFAAAATRPEPSWLADAGSAAATTGADQLAASLNRLAMRTLSLKRQCSRDDTALDALDQALLQERLEAQQAQQQQAQQQQRMGASSMSRACSMPIHSSFQQASPPLLRHQHHAPAGDLGYNSCEPQAPGWLAQEQQLARLPPLPRGVQRPQSGSVAASPFAGGAQCGAPPMAPPYGPGTTDSPAEQAERGMLFAGDTNSSALASGLDSTKRDSPAYETCPDGGSQLQEGRSGSGSGLLLHQPGSLSLSAQLGGGESGASGAAVLAGEASSVFLHGGQHVVAGVTSVGPATKSGGQGRQAPAGGGASDSFGDLASAFGLNAGAAEDGTVDKHLADFLIASPRDLQANYNAAGLIGLDSTKVCTVVNGNDFLALAALESPGGPTAVPQAAALAVPASEPAGTNGAGCALAADPGQAQQWADSPASALAQPAGREGSHDPAPLANPGLPSSAPASNLSQPQGRNADVMQLASQLATDPDPVRQLLASRLLQMQRQRQQEQQHQLAHLVQQQQGQQQQQAQQQQLATHHNELHGTQHSMLLQAHQAARMGPGPHWAASLGPGPGPSSAAAVPDVLDFQQHQAVLHTQQLQQAYLYLRQEVHGMLARRGVASATTIGSDPELAARLARLKQLKEQMLAAQAQLLELRRLQEMHPSHHDQQQQQQQQIMVGHPASPQNTQPNQHNHPNHQHQQQLPTVGDLGSAFGAGMPRLGPPPPLPQHHSGGAPGVLQSPGENDDIAALFNEWKSEADSGDLDLLQQPVGRGGVATHPQVRFQAQHWGPSLQPQQQHQLQQLLQARGQLLAQRAASAPLPDDFSWSETLQVPL